MSGSGPFQDKPAVRVEALTLARGERVLVSHLSFAAGPGSLVELRGPNGAGKTTLLRAIAGFLKPRAGRVIFDNVDEPALALHFVGHGDALKGPASVMDHVRYWQGLFGHDIQNAPPIAAFGLVKQAVLPVRVLSQGQRRRLTLARLLVAPRPVWILDEPAVGLDADGRAMLGELIESHRLRGGIAIAAVHETLGPAPDLTVTLGS